MWHVALPVENVALELTPRFGALGMPWCALLLGLVFLVPVLLVLLLSRYEMRLVRTPAVLVLVGLRLALVAVLWFMAALQPTLARHHAEEVPSEVMVAVDLSRSMEVVDVDRTDSRTRKNVVRKLLVEDGLLRRLAERHRVRLFGFHRQLWEVDVERAEELFAKADADNLATNLGLPLKRGEEKSTQLLGMVLLSDGQHNQGPPPAEFVKGFGRPLHVVGIGAKDPPPDVAVVEMKAPDNVFKDTEVQVEARIKTTGMPGQDRIVELLQKGKVAVPEHRKTLKPGEDRVRFHVKLEELGAHQLEVKVRPTLTQPAEITQANNSMVRVVRVTHDRARVLLVDDDARWEFHYLANALMRDKTPKGEPTLQVERVLLRQPRVGVISEDDLKKAGNPLTKLPSNDDEPGRKPPAGDVLSRYDVIVLGDIDPVRLPVADRRRLEEYVSQRGGTLVLQSGRRAWPLEYPADDPLTKMLPIAEARVRTTRAGFFLGMAVGGQDKPFLQMETDPGRNQQFWAEMPRHFWGIVGRPKPGATVLAFAADNAAMSSEREALEKDQALIVQMPYGFGQVFHVGLDSTWRWRYRVGDEYHHHFWGQLVRWAAADRLLPAGNRFVRYGTRAAVYRQGKDVEVAVRLSDEAGSLAKDAQAAVRVLKIGADGTEEKAAVVPLAAKAHQPNLLEGQVHDLPAGQYRLRLEIPELQAKIDAPAETKETVAVNSDTFTVLAGEENEMLDLSANWPLLAGLAQQSHGALYHEGNAQEIADRLAAQITYRESSEREHVWQDAPFVWWTLGLLLCLLTLEWVIRKGVGLP